MHPYSTDSPERYIVPFYLATVALLLAWGAHEVLGYVHFDLPWWLGPPSVLGLYGLLYRLFDEWLWKISWIRRLANVQIPDLNGQWAGIAKSSYSRLKEEVPVQVDIRQSWREITIRLDADKSQSHSEFAAVLCRRARPVLTYGYLNEPKPGAIDTMESHRGVARLESFDGSLVGDYYSGRGRQTFGSLELSTA